MIADLKNDQAAPSVRNGELLRDGSTRFLNRRTLASMALHGLWRKLTRRRAEDKGLDLRPARDKLPALDYFVQPPKPTGLDKPKY